MHTILLVEDDAETAMVVTHMFSKRDFIVEVDATGEKVHCLIESLKPVLVLMDGWLPYKDGLTLCSEIKALYKIPVIIYSAGYYPEKQISDCKADAFVEKPFDMHTLEALMHRLIAAYL